MVKECKDCSAWGERGCEIPSYDLWYACPVEAEKPENKKELLEWIDWLRAKERKEGKI